jgi:hypothetical protein
MPLEAACAPRSQNFEQAVKATPAPTASTTPNKAEWVKCADEFTDCPCDGIVKFGVYTLVISCDFEPRSHLPSYLPARPTIVIVCSGNAFKGPVATEGGSIHCSNLQEWLTTATYARAIRFTPCGLWHRRAREHAGACIHAHSRIANGCGRPALLRCRMTSPPHAYLSRQPRYCQ